MFSSLLSNKYKTILFISILIFSMLLSGCWDKVEIDERSFVLALGIDHVTPQNEGEEIPGIEMADHYRVTYVFPQQLTAFGGEADLVNIVVSSLGENIYMSERQLATRIHNEIFLGHLKAIVLGEEVVKDPHMFREVLDALEKDPNISRKISIAIAAGEAKDILEIEPKLEPVTGQFIADLFRGRDVSARVPILDLNDILISLHRNGNVAIPRLMANEEELKKGGAAIINNFEMVGWLGEQESVALMILKDRVQMFNLTIKDDNVIIPFQATEVNRSFAVEEDGENIKLTVSVDLEGDIIQHFFNPKNDVLDPKFLQGLQEKINEHVRVMVTHTVEQLQNEHKTDVMGLDDHIQKFNPHLWRRVRHDWDEVFPTVEVEVVVDSKIRRVGLSR